MSEVVMRLIYHDTSHGYWLDGVRCGSVSAIAKIAPERYTLDQWVKRQVAIGMSLDRNLCEKIAVNIEDKDLGNTVAEEAMKAAEAHRKADRGTQMHRALQLVLLDQPHKLLTEQQRDDAVILRRTLDRYGLRPHDGMAEQFVAWPDYRVGGRFDAILETADNRLLMTDLKTGPNAVTYPQSVAIQLALYARAPFISDIIEDVGGRCTVEDWRTPPARLDLDIGYVLLVPPGETVGTLYEVDIAHGWKAGQLALEIIQWRKEFNRGKDLVREVPDVDDQWSPDIHQWIDTAKMGHAHRAATAPSLEKLREIWREAAELGALTDVFKEVATVRAKELKQAS